MKLLLTILIIQFLGLTRAQSSCESDLDTFEDGTGINNERGKGCSYYQGRDCLATASTRGLPLLKKRELLWSCKHACGFCGKDTIVKQCKDNSCECKDTENWKMTTPSGQTLGCDHTSIGACIWQATVLTLSDKQVREYMTNCAASCQVCSPCSNVDKVGDGFCDPGNNNDKCYKIEKDSSKSAGFDGGDCCNDGKADPFFEEYGPNSLRYSVCAKSSSSFDKELCKCLAPPPARTKDCAGGFGDFGECSVTCGAYGVRTRKFVVLHPAQPGGRPCEFKAGETHEERCGRPSKKCPATTATTTTTTTPTTTTTVTTKSITKSKSKSTTATTTKKGESSKSPDKPVTGDSDDSDDSDSDKTKKVVVDEVDLTTVSTMMMTVVCLIYSLV